MTYYLKIDILNLLRTSSIIQRRPRSIKIKQRIAIQRDPGIDRLHIEWNTLQMHQQEFGCCFYQNAVDTNPSKHT